MMKKNISTDLRKTTLLIILLLYLGISLSFYAIGYINAESDLLQISKEADSVGLLNNKYLVEKDQGQKLEGFQYKRFERGGEKYLVRVEKISLLSILQIGLIPTIMVTFFGIYMVKREEKKISKKYLGPIINMVEKIENIMRGRIDEISEEDMRDFEESIWEIGGNPERFIDSFKELSENQKYRRQFSSNVTHELKSPLTSINGYAELLAQGMVNEEDMERFSKIILKEGRRLLNMINEIILLSKFDEGRIRDEGFEKIYLKTLLEEIKISMGGFARERNVKIEILGDNVYIFAKKSMIEDAFRNLISNAIKYSKNKGGKLRIEVYFNEGKKKDALINFIDNGIGISEKDQERIFERFFVADESRGNKVGTGLGLSLVKNIVEAHMGEIKVKSTLGRGTKFTVILPLNAEQKINEEYKLLDGEG